MNSERPRKATQGKAKILWLSLLFAAFLLGFYQIRKSEFFAELSRVGLAPEEQNHRPSNEQLTVNPASNPEAEPELVFAGLSGTPPRYIDAGPDKGLGYLEMQTEAVRKGLKSDGFRVRQEWMTPARIEHEFKIGSPICTYPLDWNHPERIFARKPDRLFSIALDFHEELGIPILFRRSDLPRFKKYIDKKGDLKIDELLEDRDFGLQLIRNKDYGRFTQKLTTLDPKGDQIVREPYEKHIKLLLVRNNQQLIEMLNAKRFDYIFAQDIEAQDFRATGLDPEQFISLNYSINKVKDLADPNLVRISIVCSVHPLSFQVIPHLNKWIALARSNQLREAQLHYRKAIDKDFYQAYQPGSTRLTSKFRAQLNDGTADRWYRIQQSYFPELKFLPDPSLEQDLSKLELNPPHSPPPPLWFNLRLSSDTVILLHRSQWYGDQYLDVHTPDQRGAPMSLWFRQSLAEILDRSLSPLSREAMGDGLAFLQGKSLTGSPGSLGGTVRPSLQESILEVIKNSGLRNLIFYARGVKATELGPLIKFLSSSALERLTLIDALPETTSRILGHLPKSLVALQLPNSSLSQANASQSILNFKLLRQLDLSSSQLPRTEMSPLLEGLPQSIEALSLDSLSPSWTAESALAFSSRKWPNLQELNVSGGCLDSQSLEKVLSGVPASIQKLWIGRNAVDFEALPNFFRIPRPFLSHLGLSRLEYYSPLKDLEFPKSLTHFDSSFGIRPLQLARIQLGGKLRSLDLSAYGYWGKKESPEALFSKLDSTVDVLNLSGWRLSSREMNALVENSSIRHIESLELSDCGLNDEAIAALCRASFSVSHLTLNRNYIRNEGAKCIAKVFLPRLKSLRLNLNLIGEEGISAISAGLKEGMETLELANVLQLNLSTLTKRIPRSIKKIDFSGNMITDAEMAILAPALPRGLAELNLSNSGFGVQGAFKLAELMPPDLSILTLENTPLTSKGFQAIARSLPKTLSEFFASQLDLEDSAVLDLVGHLPPFLRVLELKAIKWTESAVLKLLASLPDSLETLNLSGSPFWDRGARTLSEHWPGSLRLLDVSGTNLGDSGLKTLCKTLPQTLERVNLNNNQLTDEGLIAFAQHPLEHHRALELSNNQFTVRGIKALNSRKRNFYSIHLSGCGLNSEALDALGSNVLESARRIQIGNNSFANPSVTRFLQKLNPSLKLLYIPSTGLSFEGIDAVIKHLPRGLGVLQVGGNEIGEAGFRKFARFAELRDQTGVYLLLVK